MTFVFQHFQRAFNDNEAARFLLQTQLDASLKDIQEVHKKGFRFHLKKIMEQPLPLTAVSWLVAQGYASPSTDNFCFQPNLARYAITKQLLSSPQGVRQRVALALSEFFVLSLGSSMWANFGCASYFDMLNANAFGNFRQLLEAVTLHPAMGFFLNTKGNLKEDPRIGRLPDENYAREVMQLFSIGLYELNSDGTEKLDSKGKKIETYTTFDVTQLARVFTGYDVDTSVGYTAGSVYFPNTMNFQTGLPNYQFMTRPMVLNPNNHSSLSVKFLGKTIPAGTEGKLALKQALDILFNHPNTAPFFVKQMIQRLVTSNPSPAYVERVVRAFNNNGRGVRGDLQAVWMGIWMDDEARDPSIAGNQTAGKVREPMLRFIQWSRTFGVQSTSGTWKVSDLSSASEGLAQTAFQAPSVFNFFRPGYVPPNTALSAKNMVAPEMALVNEVTVAGYLNCMQNIIPYGMNPDMQPQYTTELSLVVDAQKLINHLNLVLTAGQITPANVTLMVSALNQANITPASPLPEKWTRICCAVFMVMASLDYLVQK